MVVVKLSVFTFLGSILVTNAHLPSMSKTFASQPFSLGCSAADGCEDVKQQECQGTSVEFMDGVCENEDTGRAECKCDMQFLQPTSPNKDTRKDRDAAQDYYYGDGQGPPEAKPCGMSEMLEWNDQWNVNGQTGTIPMDEKTIANADYFDCTENGGEWRDTDGPNEWPEYSGAKYCRVKFDFFTTKGPKPTPVDSFLCKYQCKQGSDDCGAMDPWPKCNCDEGTAPGKNNWQECLFDGNYQCSTCTDPEKTPVADRATSEIHCKKYDPYHLVDCGRDPTVGMRIVAQASFAPYSTDMCAYWVKQDPLCEGDYFYSINDLSVTDFSEEGWQDFYNKRSTIEERTPEDWEEERKSFVQAEVRDISGGKLKSQLSVHKQKQYGCWCRASETNKETEYITKNYPTYEQQNETWAGYAGNTYKFDVANEDNSDHGGPLLLTDRAKGCDNYNYKITGRTGEWKCPSAEPKPIFGWILAETNGEGCLATPSYMEMWTIEGAVVNLPNGKYSFLCYASNVGIYKVEQQKQRSWLPGKLSVGTKFKHNMVGSPPANEEPLCGMNRNLPRHANMFKRTFDIDNQQRPMWFVIRNWQFTDGRMYFLGEEKVEDGYDVKADSRWEACNKKFTTAAPLTESEIQSTNLMMSKTIPKVITILNQAMVNPADKLSCNTPQKVTKLMKVLKEKAKEESKNGLSFTGPQFWQFYKDSLSPEEAEKCGPYVEPTPANLIRRA